jgi:alkylhydroperoxidase/carboxymuconolactone decarboxylase family protein YurZ
MTAWRSAARCWATPEVEKSIRGKNSFDADFIDLITRHAWGEIWTRPHFDHRTRRVLVIGTMVALGQWDFACMCAPPSLRAASRLTISRRFCCSRRSIAAFPPQTTP